tara:strand:+ start:1153 stop:1470 length:318 start_codon:yes stop_codon:yes gene_type:complete
MTDIIKSIQALKSDAQVSVSADDINKITWHDGNPTNITNEQILAKQTELQAEYDALAYARSRDTQYPSLKEFVEAYTEKEIGADTTKWDEYVVKYNKVRTDNPKS